MSATTRKAVGLFNKLTPEQQSAVRAYKGPQNIGGHQPAGDGRGPTSPPPNCGSVVSHPGGQVDTAPHDVGWRTGVAKAWRAIEFKQTAQECRDAIAALGNAGPPT